MRRPPREQQAWDEVGHTEVSRPVVIVLLVLALGLMLSVAPLFWRSPKAAEKPLSRLGWAALAALGEVDASLTFNRELVGELRAFESALEDASWLQHAAQPWMQDLLTGWGGVGNEQVYRGRGGWLFYRPDVDLLTGPGFLEPRVLERRRRSGERWRAATQPDPVAALLDFHRQLAARGIALLVLPAPSKATLVPRALTSAATDPAEVRLENHSFPEFRRRLEAGGVIFFDAVPALLRARRDSGREPFLRTDTHWTPEAMDVVAEEVAHELERRGLVSPERRQQLGRARAEVRRFGDLTWLLGLPAPERRLAPDVVEVAPVHDAEGRLLRGDPQSEVLVLGDSYANIFSQPRMRWGESAGLAEQLSYHLSSPVQLIALNDGGDHALRQNLAHDLAMGHDVLAGKRVVVHVFAAHQLAEGDWRLIELPKPRTAPRRPSEAVVAHARVAALAELPAPGTTPYRDALIAVHLTGLAASGGEQVAPEALAYVWGLRDGRPAAAASWRRGEQLELRLVPWSQAPPELESLQRIELPGEELLFLDTFWVETDDANPR